MNKNAVLLFAGLGIVFGKRPRRGRSPVEKITKSRATGIADHILPLGDLFVFVSDFFLNQIWNSFFFFYYLLIGLSFFTSISSSSRLKRFESVFIGLVLLLASVFY